MSRGRASKQRKYECRGRSRRPGAAHGDWSHRQGQGLTTEPKAATLDVGGASPSGCDSRRCLTLTPPARRSTVPPVGTSATTYRDRVGAFHSVDRSQLRLYPWARADRLPPVSVAYWRFEEGTPNGGQRNGSILDSSGNSPQRNASKRPVYQANVAVNPISQTGVANNLALHS